MTDADSGSSEQALPRRRSRLLLIGGSSAVVVLLVVGLGVYLQSPDALSVEYEQYRDDQIAVDYPQGWKVEEQETEPHASWGSTTFFPPDGDENFPESAIAVGWYSDPSNDDARTESIEEWDRAVEELGLEDHVQEELDLADFGGAPRDWDAALLEDTYTGLDHLAKEMDWEDTKRFSIALQVHLVEDGETTAYWMAWYGPQNEREAYDDVIHETLESFAPLE